MKNQSTSRPSQSDEPSGPGGYSAAAEIGSDKPAASQRSAAWESHRASQRSDWSGSQSPTQRSGPSRPPYKPGLRKLIEGKQAWSEPLDDEAKARGFRGWHQRGYLPHYDVPGVTQLVTIRLHDAMPASRRSEWEALLHLEDDRERCKRLEEYLDRGLGECWLRQPAVAELAENALRFFDGERYRLAAWVVMPNHVHLVGEVWQTPLGRLAHSWKGYIARAANKLLGREGTFWEREYWDTLIKDDAHRAKAVRYVEANPVKAGLVREATEWRWSSARYRDACGKLAMPPKSADRSAGLQPALDERNDPGIQQ